jgi:hypothetical protein
MAERIVSPAVFTNEIDQTFLTQGISQIGGAVVGPFKKGPAYAPTIVRTHAELEDLFGVPEGKYYQPFTAREYLTHQGVVTIVRVGALGGYKQDNALVITAKVTDVPAELSGTLGSGSLGLGVGDEVVIGVLANTLYEGISDDSGFEGSTIDNDTSVLYHDTESVDPETGETVSVGNLETTLRLRKTVRTEDEFTGEVVETIQSLKDDFDSDYVFSIDPKEADSLQNIFGRAAKKNLEPAYFYSYFENSQEEVFNNIMNGVKYKVEVDTSSEAIVFETRDSVTGEVDDDPWKPGEAAFSCRPAETPYIKSQEISGRRYDLFKVWTRNMGSDANREIKIAIYNVRTPGSIQDSDYGVFSLMVRSFNDNDKSPEIVENYDGVTLDPLSPRYLPRVIGDRFTTIDSKGKIIDYGDYVNSSNWIRIEMPAESTSPANAMPYGHAPYRSPLGGIDVGTPEYSYASQYARSLGRFFNGAVFNQTSPDGILELPNSARDTSELFQPLPANPGDAGRGFYMDESKDVAWVGKYVEELDGETTVFEVDEVPTSPSTADELLVAKLRRFVVGFQGGFDGQSPAHPISLGKDITETNCQGLDCSREFSSGSKGYKRAFAALSNQDEFDINLLVTPGLSLDLHRSVINRGVDLCEQREDCFYILDCVSANNQPGRVDDAVQAVSTIDSNYAATYYPWVKIIDPATNVLQPYPPSSLMMAVYAANDKSAAEWFAPAGLNRGGIESAVAVMDRLNFAERDTLYEGKVNPIAAFPGQGIVAFGQKTLQRRASALDRVNVRRLLITLKKFIASSARFLLFEQNVASTRNRFLSIVNPYLENVQQRHGLYAFRVIMDESNNTPDLIDRNILYGQIFLQPARAVEFIILDFNLTPTGASFEA